MEMTDSMFGYQIWFGRKQHKKHDGKKQERDMHCDMQNFAKNLAHKMICRSW